MYSFAFISILGGIWSSFGNFKAQNAAYRFDFNNMCLSTEAYVEGWLIIQRALAELDNEAVTRNLALNLAYWTNWKLGFVTLDPITGLDNPQTLSLTGDPKTVMNGDFIIGTVFLCAFRIPVNCLLQYLPALIPAIFSLYLPYYLDRNKEFVL